MATLLAEFAAGLDRRWGQGNTWFFGVFAGMDLGLAMRPDVLADKLAEGRAGGRRVATWNTRRLPTRLTPGWTNRLFVACRGWWRGAFPLSGDVLWNPADEAAPYALIFDPRRWTPFTPVRAPVFRGWRYLPSAPGEVATTVGESPPPGGG